MRRWTLTLFLAAAALAATVLAPRLRGAAPTAPAPAATRLPSDGPAPPPAVIPEVSAPGVIETRPPPPAPPAQPAPPPEDFWSDLVDCGLG